MKRNMRYKKLLVVLSLFMYSCSTTSNYYSFDNALEMGTEKIQNDLLAGAEVAILDFKSDNENLSAYVIEEMYDKLINFGKLSIMERSRTNTIAMEVGYQLSGEVDDSEIIAIGHQLGADYVVTGQIVFSGEAYRLRVFAIDIEKGRRVASSSLNINSNDKQINYLLATKTVNNVRGTEYNTSVTGASGKTYKIGDFGPAGGIIFYDKGVFSGGWRYLEATPAETEFTAQWGASGQDVVGTVTAIGRGKRNTQLIVERLNQLGESGRAAQLCASLNFDGFNDWFLPSSDELDLMHKNLKEKGLGNFGKDWYWSSTQDYLYYAYGRGFYNYGSQNPDANRLNAYKNRTYSVRAIRAF